MAIIIPDSKVFKAFQQAIDDCMNDKSSTGLSRSILKVMIHRFRKLNRYPDKLLECLKVCAYSDSGCATYKHITVGYADEMWFLWDKSRGSWYHKLEHTCIRARICEVLQVAGFYKNNEGIIEDYFLNQEDFKRRDNILVAFEQWVSLTEQINDALGNYEETLFTDEEVDFLKFNYTSGYLYEYIKDTAKKILAKRSAGSC